MGVFAARNYAITHPDYYSINQIGMQMTEHGWGIIKMVQNKRGNPNGFNFRITSKYVDAYTFGGIACDQVDPTKIRKGNRIIKQGIDFEPNYIESIMSNLTNVMPVRCQTHVKHLLNVETGNIKSFHESLLKPFRKNRYWFHQCKMLSHDIKRKYRAILVSESETIEDQFDVYSTKNYSRKEILKDLKKNMPDTSNVEMSNLEAALQSTESAQSSTDSSE